MSTGLIELDKVIQGLWPGDNVVWQVDSTKDYIKFVHPYCTDIIKNKKEIIYFRFADHENLLPDGVKADVYNLHPEDGFESFIAEIFKVIETKGRGAYYLFDSLSDLTVDWYSDRMLANFFMLTCPYLYDYETVTYFALLRNHHTTHTINAIHNTAQVVIDIYKNGNKLYIQPLKVFKRYSKTIYMLHLMKNNKFYPVTNSITLSEIMKTVSHKWISSDISRQNMWNRIMMQAGEIQKKIDQGNQRDNEYEEYKIRLMKMVISRDEQILKLVKKYFNLGDLIDISSHMIGTGLVGGKTVGMLLARAILKNKNKRLYKKLESHDSFYIGSDVFYTYLVMSKCWWARWKQRKSENYLEDANEVYKRMLTGTFPEEIMDQFKKVLDYFGQSPIIIRSSSLLEDAYGNSFSGKYESFFCANQGNPEERLEEFLNAIKKVYASTMSHNALVYRHQRGLLDQDEQMALLIQRVSGGLYNDFFFPQAAGVGFSYNLYLWDKNIDPEAGVLRLVFGLGTRAVERISDDYTRIVALNEPTKRVESNMEEVKKYAQRKIDVLNLESNKLISEYFSDILKNITTKGSPRGTDLPIHQFASKDFDMERTFREKGIKNGFPWIITFDNLLGNTEFAGDMKEILNVLQRAYKHPVDIEFTLNFSNKDEFKINLLQCRPYQVKMGFGVVKEPGNIDDENVIIKTKGPIIGSSIHSLINRFIFIVPDAYSKLPEKDKYTIAYLIDKITNTPSPKKDNFTIMLIGPGRWGTTTPSLGVPIQFGAIKNVTILCELAEMHEKLIPDISLGTHFFNDLVELDILYIAVNPRSGDDNINKSFFANSRNILVELLPEAEKWQNVIRVIDTLNKNKDIYLNANAIEQTCICYKANNTRETD